MTKKLPFNVFFQSMLRIKLCRNLPSSKLYEKLVFRHADLIALSQHLHLLHKHAFIYSNSIQ